MTAAVFAHFVGVTGPSMSLYERHPFEVVKMLDRDVHITRHNIWSYTFPILSFTHPALMQAILALGSLQIATLQQAPPTAAMKHYHLGIRHLARCVSKPARRTNPATIAATMLLAYFEVCSSDHSKWCNHLYGTRILLAEIPFRAMTVALLPIKRACPRHRNSPFSLYLDIDLLNCLSGSHFSPADYGQADVHASNTAKSERNPCASDREIEQYEHLRDLFWWYAKMDIYQGILGGTKLFMEYAYWPECPPRAPVGMIDAIYGTFDHLMLLVARLVDFAARDVERKRQLFRHKGPPGSSPPGFFGMMPNTGNASAPSAFSTSQAGARYAAPSPVNNAVTSDTIDLEASTEQALAQWQSIHDAFEAIRIGFGPHFEPLRGEDADRRDSPFGQVLQYRTFSIAGIWMNYHMGRIHLHRVHPSMPPFSLMAAGRAYDRTKGHGELIGRIAAGLVADNDLVRHAEVGTLVAAALIESSFCLFVAGVQFRRPSHRRWLIRRLHTVARLTGWMSARQIANGCESAWTKASQLAGGPIYVADDPESAQFVAVPAAAAANGTGIYHHQHPDSIPALRRAAALAFASLAPRRIDLVIRRAAESKLSLVRSEQTHYALGLLGVERDMEQLDLKDNAV